MQHGGQPGTAEAATAKRLQAITDEISGQFLERTAVVRALVAAAGAAVTLLTFDTSQAARARNAGLTVKKLAKPLGDEPEDTRGKKTRQPAASAQT